MLRQLRAPTGLARACLLRSEPQKNPLSLTFKFSSSSSHLISSLFISLLFFPSFILFSLDFTSPTMPVSGHLVRRSAELVASFKDGPAMKVEFAPWLIFLVLGLGLILGLALMTVSFVYDFPSFLLKPSQLTQIGRVHLRWSGCDSCRRRGLQPRHLCPHRPTGSHQAF